MVVEKSLIRLREHYGPELQIISDNLPQDYSRYKSPLSNVERCIL